jgi:hypothetical protein
MSRRLLPTGSKATATARASSDRAVEAFQQAVGGRAALIDALEIGSPRPEIDKVLDLLADGRFDRTSLREVCDLAGITVAELMVAFRSATLIKAQIAATAQIAARIGPIVDDVLTRAAPHDAICETCGGRGQITPDPTRVVPNPSPQPCRPCQGRGHRRVVPDLERQKLALDLAELLKKSGGLTITQQQMTVLPASRGGVGDLERLQAALGDVFTGPIDPTELAVLEAEVVSAAPAPGAPTPAPSPDAPAPEAPDAA